MTSANSWCSTYHLFKEADDNVWVYESCVVSNEGFGDVSHDTGVVAWKAFGSINLQKETRPGSLGGEAFWYQKVSGKEGHQKLEEQPVYWQCWSNHSSKLNRSNVETMLGAKVLSMYVVGNVILNIEQYHLHIRWHLLLLLKLRV